jgi:lauroyl/myristoyl acyltransferase
MVRTSNNKYHLHIKKIDASDPTELIDNIYKSLETIVLNHPEQWYFLHEEIPFVEESLLPT